MNLNKNAKRVLVFGDSNTWGRVPGDDNNQRYDLDVRWPGLLQELLGVGYEVIEESLNGRTTNLESPHKAGKNGVTYLFACLESQKPIDLVVLALGKNDLKAKFGRSPKEIGDGIEYCIEVIGKEGRDVKGQVPKVIILTPAIIEEIPRLRWGKMEVDFLGAKTKSKRLPKIFKKIADKNNAGFLDLTKIVKVSMKDGVHLEPDAHRIIAKEVARLVMAVI